MNATKRAFCSLDSEENEKQISRSVNAATGTCLKVVEKLFRSYFEFMFVGKEDHLHARSVNTMVMKRIGRPG